MMSGVTQYPKQGLKLGQKSGGSIGEFEGPDEKKALIILRKSQGSIPCDINISVSINDLQQSSLCFLGSDWVDNVQMWLGVKNQGRKLEWDDFQGGSPDETLFGTIRSGGDCFVFKPRGNQILPLPCSSSMFVMCQCNC